MAKEPKRQHECAICKKTFPMSELMLGELIRPAVVQAITTEFPAWSPEQYICKTDLARFRAKHIQDLLSTEKGDLSSLEQEVVQSMKEHELLTVNIDDQFGKDWSFADRLSDRIASFGGSWRFLIWFFVLVTVWIIANSLVMLWRPVDPYPFILLNLVLSCLAAVQAPIIMMSQNRQEAKDRLRSKHDYLVNLKAELEIRHLHEKIDHLLVHQWERLVQIQEVQLDVLSELEKRK